MLENTTMSEFQTHDHNFRIFLESISTIHFVKIRLPNFLNKEILVKTYKILQKFHYENRNPFKDDVYLKQINHCFLQRNLYKRYNS